MSSKLLVDTSVFIDFFRGERDTNLGLLILEDRVVLSQIVMLEITTGITKAEFRKVFHLLGGLEVLPDFPPPIACQELLVSAKDMGLQGGIPDLLILADCHVHQLKLHSTDVKLNRLARALKVPVVMA